MSCVLTVTEARGDANVLHLDFHHGTMDRQKSKFQKNIYFCFIDYAKAFDCVDINKLWKSLQEMGIPDHLTCLLKNLYAVKK